MRRSKLHLFPKDRVIHAVLDGTPIKAACGIEKVLTKDNLNASVEPDRESCRRCLRAVGDLAREST